MKDRVTRIASVFILAAVFFASAAGGAFAQAGEPANPPRPLAPVDAPNRTGETEQVDESSLDSPEALGPQAISAGPDDYGYTFASTAFAWVDATAGTDTGLSGYSSAQAAGPVSLPFAFPFYENTYTSVWIAASGYLAFDASSWPIQRHIPGTSTPNNVIAPFWTPIYIGSSAWVHYRSGGSAPNRYFVVEWHDVAGGVPGNIGANELYRFEAILYENGTIDFQYHTMTIVASFNCGTAGIEDSGGTDGLTSTAYCAYPASSSAVRFTRPVPSAHVKVKPAYVGGFATPGDEVVYRTNIYNIGELGADTFNLTPSTLWPLTMYAANGTTALTDTNSDGIVDSGLIPQGSSATIILKVQAPGGAMVGDGANGTINVTSVATPSRTKQIEIRTAIPTEFAQIFKDNLTDFWPSLYLVHPVGQVVKTVSQNIQYGSDLTTVETGAGNFVNAWSTGQCADLACSVYVYELRYSILNRFGEVVRNAAPLESLSKATVDTRDWRIAVASTPDGRIGIAWIRQLTRLNGGQWEYNDNVMFAVLDPAGGRIYGPKSLTDNAAWYGTPGGVNTPRFDYPQIAASGDNRFTLAWYRYQTAPGCSMPDCRLDDIYYAVRTSQGAVVREATNLTNDVTGSSFEIYSDPGLTALAGNRMLLIYARATTDDLHYMVLDNGGNPLTNVTNLNNDGDSAVDDRPDAVQLPSGNIVIAWSAIIGDMSRIRFAVLNPAYQRIVGPVTLNNPAGIYGEDRVSVTTDPQGRAVLTWMDQSLESRDNLYYALVDSGGAVITQPMIFLTGKLPDPFIETSYLNYGNASYSSNVLAGVDAALDMPAGKYYVGLGNPAALQIHYANHGAATATNNLLTLTLGDGLTYATDDSGITPTVNGNTITWSLPDLLFLEEGSFTVKINMKDGDPIGTSYPFTFDLSTVGEVKPDDNSLSGQVVISQFVFLPIIQH